MLLKKTLLAETISTMWTEDKDTGEMSIHYKDAHPWAMSDVIDSGTDLSKFCEEDWHYSAQFDVLFVRRGSPLYTWLCLKV